MKKRKEMAEQLAFLASELRREYRRDVVELQRKAHDLTRDEWNKQIVHAVGQINRLEAALDVARQIMINE